MIVVTIFLVCVMLLWASDDKVNAHPPPPAKLVAMVAAIKDGRIPESLESIIPPEYEVCDSHSMEGCLTETFVGTRSYPAWCVELVLDDGVTVTSQCIIFDLNGDFYD